MKKRIPAIVIVLAIAGVAAWLALNLRAKAKYDKARTELMVHVLSEVQMDADANALVSQVRTSWVQHHSGIGGPHSDALKTLGLRPSVSNLVHVFTYRLPEYSFLSIGQNKTSTIIGVIQGTLMPVTIDKSIHVSDNGHLALVHIGSHIVSIFADEDTGLREESYYEKAETVEHPPGGDLQKAAPRE